MDSYCDQGLAEAVNSIIYAAPRCDVKELNEVMGRVTHD
jgi:hypothetical protein